MTALENSHPVDQQKSGSQRRLIVIVINQAFAVTGEHLHIALEFPVQWKAPVQLNRAAQIPKVHITAQKE